MHHEPGAVAWANPNLLICNVYTGNKKILKNHYMKNFISRTFSKLTVLFTLLFSFTQILNAGASEPPNDSAKNLEKELSPFLFQAFNELNFAGAIVGVWMKGYEPYATAFGVSDLSTKVPMKTDDKMRIGSVSKTFTATVLLQLVDEGKINLSDNLSKYFLIIPMLTTSLLKKSVI